MGSDGKFSKLEGSPNYDADIFQRAPHSKPPFTLSDLRNAIPPHCFRRSLIRSTSYLVLDLTLFVLLIYIVFWYIDILPKPVACMAWPVYWFMQGCVMTGIWVVAHECGHQAFSDYGWVNDLFGFILHSALLLPYFSWKFSHRRHHANTCSMEHDEVFVPRYKDSIQWYYRWFNNPPGRILTLALTLLLGWPLYLSFNASGRKYDGFASHYYPNSPIFSSKERFYVGLSDIGVMTAFYTLYRIASIIGLLPLLGLYWVPLLVMNAFLVAVTYLQHTHIALPHYNSDEWEWLKGAVATVDRDYGFLNTVFHNITDTHVVHHLFPTMPHYHAKEATRIVKPIMKEYYMFDKTPFFKAIWGTAKECLYVEADDHKGILWFKSNL